MTARIKVTFDESAFSRLYLWLLSLDNETPALEKQDFAEKPESGIAASGLIPGDEPILGDDLA